MNLVEALNSTFKDPESLSNPSFKYMNKYAPKLENTVNNGSPYLDKLLGNRLSDIRSKEQKDITGIREQMAQQGLSSPLGINVENQASANADNAITNATATFGQMQESEKMKALSQLFGIDQAELQKYMADKNYQFQQQQLAQQRSAANAQSNSQDLATGVALLSLFL